MIDATFIQLASCYVANINTFMLRIINKLEMMTDMLKKSIMYYFSTVSILLVLFFRIHAIADHFNL
jgi:hypothetical protein